MRVKMEMGKKAVDGLKQIWAGLRRPLISLAGVGCIVACAGASFSATAASSCQGLKVNLQRQEMANAAPYTLQLRTPEAFLLQRPSESGSSHQNGLRTDRPYSVAVRQAARIHKVDAELIHAVITQESNYNPNAVSPKGAQGLMQLMPDTARRYGLSKDIMRPECNILAGTAYLRELLTLFDSDPTLALAAYNAGENAVIRYGNKIPPYRETREYVPKVLGVYKQLKPQQPANNKHKRYPAPLSVVLGETPSSPTSHSVD